MQTDLGSEFVHCLLQLGEVLVLFLPLFIRLRFGQLFGSLGVAVERAGVPVLVVLQSLAGEPYLLMILLSLQWVEAIF